MATEVLTIATERRTAFRHVSIVDLPAWIKKKNKPNNYGKTFFFNQ